MYKMIFPQWHLGQSHLKIVDGIEIFLATLTIKQ